MKQKFISIKRENPRYEIVGNPEQEDDWHPNDWIGKSTVANKRDYIALPPKIELCLAFQLDSRHYDQDQNAQFYKASKKFNDFYVRRRKRDFSAFPNSISIENIQSN